LQSKNIEARKAALMRFQEKYFPADPDKGSVWTESEAKKITSIVIGLLGDPAPEIRIEAVSFALATQSSKALERVSNLLKDPDDRVRAAAASIYQFVSIDEKTLRQLEETLHDTNAAVRRAAAYSLWPHCRRVSPTAIQEAHQKEQEEEVKQSLAKTLKCAVKQEGR